VARSQPARLAVRGQRAADALAQPDRRRVDFFTKSRAFDSTRARTEIGYAPTVGLREGIGRTLAAYRQAGWL